MNGLIDNAAVWLADYFLLATALLVLVLVVLLRLSQPVRRLVVIRASLVALALVAVLCALPGWSVVHLMTAADQVETPVPAETRVLDREFDDVGAWGRATASPQLPDELGARLDREPSHPAPQPPTDRTAAWTWSDLPWTTIAVSTYAAGSTLVLLWLAIGAVAAHRLRLRAESAPRELFELFDELTRRSRAPLGVAAKRRKPELLVSDDVSTAIALGVLRPVVILPRAWTESKASHRLGSVLAHEWTHVAGGDLRWLAVSRAVLVLLWAQPLFWLLRRRMRLDQEALADAAAADVAGRQSYAAELVAWARAAVRPRIPAAAAVGLWEGPSQLRRRIALLLDERSTVLRSCSRAWRFTAIILLVASAITLSLVTVHPQSLAQSEVEGAQPASASQERQIDSTKDPSDAPAPTTGAGQPIRSRRARPEPNTIVGRCVDENGEPIVDASVMLLFLGSETNRRPKAFVNARTDIMGRYRFDNAPAFRVAHRAATMPAESQVYEVIARAPGRATVTQVATADQLEKTGVNFQNTMLPAATLRGRVIGPGGQPVQGALVTAGTSFSQRMDGVKSARTDADGRYEITDVEPYDSAEAKQQEDARRQVARAQGEDFLIVLDSPHVLTVDHPEFARAIAPYDKAPGTKDMQLEPPANIAGRVTYGDTGPPAAGVIVHAARSRPRRGAEPDVGTYVYQTWTRKTDAQGGYLFSSLPAGQYDIWTDALDWNHPGIGRVRAVQNDVATADIVLTKGGTVRATLVDAATNKAMPLTGTEELVLNLQLTSDRLRLSRRPMITRRSEVDEMSTTEARFPAGVYRPIHYVVTVNNEPQWQSRAADWANNPNASPIVLFEGETWEVQLPVRRIEPEVPAVAIPLRDAQAGSATQPRNVQPQKERTPVNQSTTDDQAAAEEPVDISVIVAKHVMLLGGAKIVEWADVERMIRELPDPTQAHPGFYFTRAGTEEHEDEIRTKIWDLRQRQPMRGHSWGSVSPRASLRYDAIRTADDLVPDPALRNVGTVETPDGKPAAAAEIVLLAPVPAELSYKTLDVYLSEHRVRQFWEEVATRADASGFFFVYPEADQPYYAVALHESGFALVRSDAFQRDATIRLQPWARISGRVKADARFKQSAQLTIRVPAKDGWPEVSFHHYEAENTDENGAFEFTKVPPSLDVQLGRSIEGEQGISFGLPVEELRLGPSEAVELELDPPSDEDVQQLDRIREFMQMRRARNEENDETEPEEERD